MRAMLAAIKDWFFDHQVKLAIGLGVVSAAIVLCLDERGPQAVAKVLVSVLLIYAGDRLVQYDTSENWLSISYGQLIKNVIGSVLMLFGWVGLLRGVIALAIAAILLRMG
jgi:hypothetical protein